MCPPTGRRVELWKATDVPAAWEHVGNAIEVDYYSHDPAFFRYEGRWWLVTDRGNDEVMVYYSDELEATDWTPHAENPVVADRITAARQGGPPIVTDDGVFVFFQDLRDQYGDKVRAYRVTELTPETYADEELPASPVAAEFGTGWNETSMHTFDPWYLGPEEGWRCAVDGTRASGEYAIGIFDAPATSPKLASEALVRMHGVAVWYDFDHVAGGTVYDRSGNGRHAMARGTRMVDSTTFGVGRAFPSDGDRIVMPHDFADLFRADTFSLLLAVSADGAPEATALDYGKLASDRGLVVEAAGSSWRVTVSDGPRKETTEGGNPSRTTWLALVRGGDEYRAYADGTDLGSASGINGPGITAGYAVLGDAMVGGRRWPGEIYGYWLFDGVLDAEGLRRFVGKIT
uniref:glucosamine inositolphosphorylceramide transferase family protein n=1 Tax=Halegenticoccus tardaugens TaxID=2071624 RepID=UPI00100B7BF9|nr:hypothetical protein [Halegenticoccus tardaugens]